MSYTVREIADALAADVVGDASLTIAWVSEPATAGQDDLALAMNPKFADQLAKGAAKAALLWPDADWRALGLEAAILPRRPRYAMSGLTQMLDKGQGFEAVIHPSAVIDPTAILGEGVSVGPLAVISAGVIIGEGSVIGPQCFIGADTTIGAGAYLREQVSIGARATIGARFIAQPGVSIGGDGFSFVTPELSGVEAVRASLGDQGDTKPQEWARIHSLGSVTIGDDVEIGTNSSIDSGTIRDTRIGNGTKMDSLVQVGHNAVIGNHTLICGQAGVAGSANIGNFVVMGGHCAVSDNLTVGDGAILGGGTKLMTNVPSGRAMLGYPATQMDKQVEIYKAQRRLPRLLREVAEMRKVVFKTGKED